MGTSLEILCDITKNYFLNIEKAVVKYLEFKKSRIGALENDLKILKEKLILISEKEVSDIEKIIIDEVKKLVLESGKEITKYFEKEENLNKRCINTFQNDIDIQQAISNIQAAFFKIRLFKKEREIWSSIIAVILIGITAIDSKGIKFWSEYESLEKELAKEFKGFIDSANNLIIKRKKEVEDSQNLQKKLEQDIIEKISIMLQFQFPDSAVQNTKFKTYVDSIALYSYKEALFNDLIFFYNIFLEKGIPESQQPLIYWLFTCIVNKKINHFKKEEICAIDRQFLKNHWQDFIKFYQYLESQKCATYQINKICLQFFNIMKELLTPKNQVWRSWFILEFVYQKLGIMLSSKDVDWKRKGIIFFASFFPKSVFKKTNCLLQSGYALKSFIDFTAFQEIILEKKEELIYDTYGLSGAIFCLQKGNEQGLIKHLGQWISDIVPDPNYKEKFQEEVRKLFSSIFGIAQVQRKEEQSLKIIVKSILGCVQKHGFHKNNRFFISGKSAENIGKLSEIRKSPPPSNGREKVIINKIC